MKGNNVSFESYLSMDEDARQKFWETVDMHKPMHPSWNRTDLDRRILEHDGVIPQSRGASGTVHVLGISLVVGAVILGWLLFGSARNGSTVQGNGASQFLELPGDAYVRHRR